jgi:hypothetical protein
MNNNYFTINKSSHKSAHKTSPKKSPHSLLSRDEIKLLPNWDPKVKHTRKIIAKKRSIMRRDESHAIRGIEASAHTRQAFFFDNE